MSLENQNHLDRDKRLTLPANKLTPICAARSLNAVTDVFATPNSLEPRVTQLLFGEVFATYQEQNDWALIQILRDNYVGWIKISQAAIERKPKPPTHQVIAFHTPIFQKADIKSAIDQHLSKNAQFSTLAQRGAFHQLVSGGWVWAEHCIPANSSSSGWQPGEQIMVKDSKSLDAIVSSAKSFIGTPYIWGGRSFFGIDCSALIQLACQSCDIDVPRDSDMQRAYMGRSLDAQNLAQVRYGDLIFWAGHVGIMIDGTYLLHANAFHMSTAVEPLAQACDRIAKKYGKVIGINRLVANEEMDLKHDCVF